MDNSPDKEVDANWLSMESTLDESTAANCEKPRNGTPAPDVDEWARKSSAARLLSRECEFWEENEALPAIGGFQISLDSIRLLVTSHLLFL